MAFLRKIFGGLLLIISLLSSPALADETLSISAVYQQTPVWCWAAVGEMVFRHYDTPSINPAGNYQCGIAALMHPACEFECRNCFLPAGSLAYMNNMLTQYPQVVRSRTGISTGHISTRAVFRSLTMPEVKKEIDRGRPIVSGISPSGFSFGGTSQHVALIIGYEEKNNSRYLIVNDPFPYEILMFQGRPDPYIAAGGSTLEPGQYRIKFENFRDRLSWRESIYRIRCTGEACPN